jgi:hypothetical protein
MTTMRARTTAPVIGERELRRQIDKCISRALFDSAYASQLLADPTTILEEHDCPAQEYLSLRSINASSLVEFARQARELFWVYNLTRAASPEPLAHDDVGELTRHDNDALNARVSNVLFDTR